MTRCRVPSATSWMKWPVTLSLVCLLTVVMASPLLAQAQNSRQSNHPSWSTWLAEFRKEALADGIRPAVFDMAFENVAPSRRVVKFDRSQPERRLTYKEYRKSRIDAYRIKLGKQKMRKHYSLLQEIAHDYGVDPCIIVALWGMESSYGHYKGNFPVIKSLATLAFDGRRSTFFRKELLHALHIIQEGHVELKDFKGEWAGASGHSQFLPSSWRNYAVDHDGDGDRDIWNSLDDVFASIANYLKQNGWETDHPWAVEVRAPQSLPRGFDHEQHTISQWKQLGVKSSRRHPLNTIDPDLAAWLIEPYGGPAILAFNNFKVIKRYNNSNYYAGSIGYLAEQICRG